MDVANRRAAFKKTFNVKDARKGRQEHTLAIRKNKKVEALHKRRNIVAPPPLPSTTATKDTKEVVADAPPALQNVSSTSGPEPSEANLAQYVADIQSDDPERQYKGVNEVRRLLSKEKDPPVEAVLKANVLTRLLHFMHTGDQKIQFEAAWAVTNIASTEHTAVVVEAGAVPLLVHLLRSPSDDVREQCIWCLGNIAGDGYKFRDLVLKTPNALENLMLNIQHPANVSLLKNATWTLSNYCRGKPQPPLEAVKPVIPALMHLAGSHDDEILTDACWGLSYLTDGEDARIQAVVDAGVAPRLVQLMGHSNTSVIIPALRAAGNIVTGNDTQTQAIIDCGGLRAFAALISHERRNIRREACWAASNVAAGTPAQIAALVDTPGMVPALLNQMDKGEWVVRKEAVWAISNTATTGSEECLHKLVQMGVVAPLVRALNVEDPKVVMVALEAVGAILDAGGPLAGGMPYTSTFEEAGGLDALEELQTHTADDVYEKAVSLIEIHYGAEDDEDANEENTAPGVASGDSSIVGKTFEFGVTSSAPSPFTFGATPAAAPSNPFFSS